MLVPLLDLKAQHEPLHQELMRSLEHAVKSGSFILGPCVRELESHLAAYCRTKHAVAVSSGTDALLIALMALGIGPGDEVVTTPFSFFATAGVIARVGAKPVFTDIDPITFNIDPNKLEAAITPSTRAIIPVHLYGQCSDMVGTLEVAGKYGAAVIEDAAQALGAEFRDGRRAGSMGAVGCFSFFPSKNLGAMGDAGLVATNDPDLAETLRILRVHGAKPKYYHQCIGGNFRMDELQAAVLKVKLPHLDTWTRKRQENAERYTAMFKEAGLAPDPVKLPEAVYNSGTLEHYHIYNQYVLRVPERDRLRSYLNEKGVGSEVYYPVPFHLQECFQYLGYGKGDFPEAERAALETLAIPVYPELTAEQQRYVVETIRAFF